MDDGEWRKTAVCRNHDPDLWFPIYEYGEQTPIAICATCPHTGVDGPCYGEAVRNNEVYGVWGGVLFGRGGGHAPSPRPKKRPACRTCGVIVPHGTGLTLGAKRWCSLDCYRTDPKRVA